MTTADIATLTRFLTKTTTTSYTNAQLLLTVNAALERIGGRIITETAGGQWKWGDINFSALPTYTMNLTNSTNEYQIDSLTGVLQILGAEVLDQNGIWHLLDPITLEDIRAGGEAEVEFYKTDGRPVVYQKRENMIILHPAPDNGVSVTLTAGLKIFFLRGMSAITDMTSTTAIGFPIPWHDYLAWSAAYDYAVANGFPNVNHFKAEMNEKEEKLLKFIVQRDQDVRYRIIGKKRPFR